MFFRTVPVTPNTPYKVTCMVKTKNIENSETTNLEKTVSVESDIDIEENLEDEE